MTDRTGRILLVSSKLVRTYWNLPGGKAHLGEPPRVACRRELEEELRVRVTVGAMLTTTWNPDQIVPYRDWHSHLFDCGTHDSAVVDQQIRLAEGEIQAWQWVDPETAVGILQPSVAAALRAARAGIHYIEYTPTTTRTR